MITAQRVQMIVIPCMITWILCFQASSFVIVSNECRSKFSQSLEASWNSRILPLSTSLHQTTKTSSGFFQNLFGSEGGNSNNDNNNNISSKEIISIEATNVKIGALRFLLNIHLVGEQNNPVPKSWLCQQSDNTNNELIVYYQDGTASLTIQLRNDAIVFIRNGMKPSLQYQIQESSLIHNILDELQSVAFGIIEDKDVTADQRLLQLNDANTIEIARSKLLIQREK